MDTPTIPLIAPKAHPRFLREEAGRCMLCEQAPCTAACPRGKDPARAMRAIRFDDWAVVGSFISGEACAGCDAPCEKACIHYDLPVRLSRVAASIPATEPVEPVDLSIDWCGIHCENPFFLASSAVCTNYEMVARAFDAGWAGVFFKTICMQEIREVSPRFDALRDEKGAFIGFRNMEQLSENPVDLDFEILARLKKDYPGKVVVASIMGADEDQWVYLAKRSEEAGCDAVELNFSCPQMKTEGMGSDVGQSPELVARYTYFVKQAVKIPVIPKMTPNITSIDAPATACMLAGADGISAINTIKSVTMPDRSSVTGLKTISGYSGKAVKPIALRHVLNIVAGSVVDDIQLSGIGGIASWRDALDFIDIGCQTVQVCTAVMEYGYRIIDDLILGLSAYMREAGAEHVSQLVGERLPLFVLPSDLDRDTMVYPVVDKNACIGCGRCYRSCQDGGHQAISFGEDRKPRILGAKCVGCHLCLLVCPTGAISSSKRVPRKG